MTDIILDNIYLILLIPFWLFLIIMLGRFFSVYVNKNIIYALTLLSSFLSSVFCGYALLNLSNNIETQIPFVKINNFIISAGLYIDKTALIFALTLFVVSFLVQLFSISYMKKEKKTYRFYALLNLFNFAMAGLFFSQNLFQSYVFWEIVGVVSYLLIGFEYFKKEKSIASKKVFITNRIGDTALLCAIISCSYLVYSYSNNYQLTTLSFADIDIISVLVDTYTLTPLFIGICLLFIIAATVKSAQFPFYTWLQDAMEAKLPVSALLHSATMVASGVFLLIRLYPFFNLETSLLNIIAIIGLITAIMCSFSACAQLQPKKVLAYSTSAQLGLMFFALGMSNIKAAIILFVAHALIKSMLFLTLEEEKFSFANFVLFLIGGLSLSGVIFSGMIAKEFLYLDLPLTLKVVFSLISFLTAFYIIRIALIIGMDKEQKKIPYVPIILTLLNIIFYLFIRTQVKYEVSEPFWAALTAWVCVYILYIKSAFWKVPILYPLTFNGFYLDKFYTDIVANWYSKFATCLNTIDTKILSNYTPLIYTAKLGVKISDYIEKNIMNGTVKLITDSAKNISKFDLKSQNGNVQRYNAYAFIILTLIITCLIIGYACFYLYYMEWGGNIN